MCTRVPAVSIVVATRNGSDTLPLMLRGVAGQTCASETIELVVVDDGSSDATPDLAIALAGVPVTRLRQEASGAAAARNRGAAEARGRILIFLDDDVELAPGAIEALIEAHRRFPRTIVTGVLEAPAPSNAFERLHVIRATPPPSQAVAPIEFTACYTGLLSVHADVFATCGGFEDPTGGTPSWDDIDFGYRARRAGFSLLQCATARAIHHDRTAGDLQTLCRRWHAASVSAIRLFQRHPGMEHAFVMYRDKLPVRWHRDSPWLVARKLLRSAVSCRPVQTWAHGAAHALAASGRVPVLARPLCGVVVSGSIWRGIRDGLDRYGALSTGDGGQG